MGPSGDRPPPHTLCFSSSLKYLDNSMGCRFPEWFCRCETLPPLPRQMEELFDDREHIAPGLLEPKD